MAGTVGIIVNPMSGRDVRRLAARASQSTIEDKRDQVARAVVGAVAAGAERVLMNAEPFRIAKLAVASLRLDAELEIVETPVSHTGRDSARAAEAFRAADCGALVALGGDGTHRAIATAWPSVPLVPVSTGTNNVFPIMVEATLAGAAAGLVASGGVAIGEVARPAKVVRVEIEDEANDMALVDAVLLVEDRVGNLLPFDPACIRYAVLARAEPASIGMSPIGGLLMPSGAADEFGVEVRCVAPDDSTGRPLLAPISAGLYQPVQVSGARRLELGERVAVKGPGVLAFDGDRERTLADGQQAWLSVQRDGPRVIDVARALALAAERELYRDRGHWHDAKVDGNLDAGCC